MFLDVGGGDSIGSSKRIFTEREHMGTRLLFLFLAFHLVGCVGIGPPLLSRDQLDYADALSKAQKRQMLFNVVRLRYGDVPVFLSASQIISGYTLQGTAQAGVNAYPNVPKSSSFSAQGTLDYIDHPTFTFTPVVGEQFAESYIRPLSPAQLLPLAQSGLPVDVLLRMGVQAIGDLQNSNPLSGSARAGSPDFFRLLADLRMLQVANALSLRLQKETSTQKQASSVRIFFCCPIGTTRTCVGLSRKRTGCSGSIPMRGNSKSCTATGTWATIGSLC